MRACKELRSWTEELRRADSLRLGTETRWYCSPDQFRLRVPPLPCVREFAITYLSIGRQKTHVVQQRFGMYSRRFKVNCSARESLTVSSVSAVTALSLFSTLLFVIFCNMLTLQPSRAIVDPSQHSFYASPQVQRGFGAIPPDLANQLIKIPSCTGALAGPEQGFGKSIQGLLEHS